MKKRDLILISVIIAAAIILYVAMMLGRSGRGDILKITVDGKVFGEYELNTDQTINIETDSGINVLIIENGYAYMKKADCPDKYCIKQGKIDNGAQTIVCLPHKVVAEIITDDTKNEPEVDIIR